MPDRTRSFINKNWFGRHKIKIKSWKKSWAVSLTALWVTIMHFEKNNISDLKCEKCGRDEKNLDEKGRNYINKN